MKGKKNNNEQVEALQSQAKTVMSDTTVPVDERIQRTAGIYRQAENVADESGIDDKKHESLLSDSARFFYDYGMYKEALSRYTLLIALRETIYGQDHAITATAYHDIGEVYRNLCDYAKALNYNQKSLDIREKVLGQKCLETAESYNDTGLVYFYQGYYDKATEFILKAKAIREEIVGTNHQDTAESYANLGQLYMKQEDYDKGLENYSKALDIYESTLSSEHRETGIAYHGVGLAYFLQGNCSDALDYCSKALAVYEKVLGINHPETAVIYMGLGYIHDSIGGHSKALRYVTQSLEINEKMLGHENLNTALSYYAVGWVKYRQADNQEVLDCYEKGLNITEKILGLAHPDTAEAYYNMGMMYYFVDDNVKAYECYLNALEIYKKCPATEFIDNKMNHIKAELESLEDKPEEESKGTRDLFLETLTKIGCQYEIEENEDVEEGDIRFGYQGEYFVVRASNKNRFIQIYDTHWGHVELYDIDEFARLKKAINESNIRNSVTTVYTIDEAGNNVDVHCKSVILFMPEIPDIADYLRLELSEYFRVHETINMEMAKQREADANIK